MCNQPLTVAQKIDFLMREKNEQRGEILEIDRTYFKTLFAFFAILGVFASLYLSEDIFKNLSIRTALLFVLSQIQFVMVIFSISLIALQNVHVGYVRSLEETINRLAECNISSWDSHVALEYIVKPRCTLFIANVVIYLFYLGGIAGAAFLCWQEFGRNELIAVYACEIVIALGLFARSMSESHKARELTENRIAEGLIVTASNK